MLLSSTMVSVCDATQWDGEAKSEIHWSRDGLRRLELGLEADLQTNTMGMPVFHIMISPWLGTLSEKEKDGQNGGEGRHFFSHTSVFRCWCRPMPLGWLTVVPGRLGFYYHLFLVEDF